MRFGDFILFEMAYHQDKAIEKIEDLFPQLTRHILKVWLMPKSRDYRHWLGEITNWLGMIEGFSRVKTPSKRISLRKFETEFDGYFDERTIKNFLYGIKIQYDLTVGPTIAGYLSRRIQNLYHSLWVELSQGTFDIEEFIKEFINGQT